MPHSALKGKAGDLAALRSAAAASPHNSPLCRMGFLEEERQSPSGSGAHELDEAEAAVVVQDDDSAGEHHGAGHDDGRTQEAGVSTQASNASQKGGRGRASGRGGVWGESSRKSQASVRKAGPRKQKNASASSQSVQHSQGLGLGGGVMQRSLTIAGSSRPGTQVAGDDVFDFDDDAPAHSTQPSQTADKSASENQGTRAIERPARPAGGGEAGGGDGGRGGVRAMFAFSVPTQPHRGAKGGKGGKKGGARKGSNGGQANLGSQCSRTSDAGVSQPLTLRQRLAAAPQATQTGGKQKAPVLDAIADFSDDDDAFAASASVVGGGGNGGMGRSRIGVGMGWDAGAADAADSRQNSPGQAAPSGGMSLGTGAGGEQDDMPNDAGDNLAPAKTPARSILKEIGALAQATPMWNTNARQRNKRSRSKGELGKMLERHLCQHEQDLKLFEHARQVSSAPNSSDAGLAGESLCTFASAMRWFVAVIIQEHREANLMLCVCRAAAPDGPRYLHIVWPSLVHKLVPNLVVGCVVKLFAPWDPLVLSPSGTQIVLASERCEVARMLDPETLSLPQVDQVLAQFPAGMLPKEITEEPAGLQPAARSVERLAISSLPLVNLSLSDECVSQESSILIKDLDAWMTTVTQRGSVLRSFPRGVLIKDFIYDHFQHERQPTRLSWLANSLGVPEMPIKTYQPMFWIADRTGFVAVKVPEALAHSWLPVLLGAQGGLVEYSFSKLGFASAVGGMELSRNMRLEFTTPEGDQLPVSPSILVVTPRSSFQMLHSPGAPPVLAADSHSSDHHHLSSRKLLLDVLTSSEHRECGIGLSEKRLLGRATVMVTVEHIATVPSAAWSKESQQLRQLLLCVQDESLASDGIHNVLLVITDHAQLLATAVLVQVGDVLLIRDALVCPSAHCSGRPPFPENIQPHSTFGSLCVDDVASISRVYAGSDDGGGPVGGEGGVHATTHAHEQQRMYDQAEGCLLPRVFIEEKYLSALQEKDTDVARKEMLLPALSQQTTDTSAWQSFAGMITNIAHVKTSSACPYCRARELQELMPHEESASIDSSCCSDRFLCQSCQKIFTVSAHRKIYHQAPLHACNCAQPHTFCVHAVIHVCMSPKRFGIMLALKASMVCK